MRKLSALAKFIPPMILAVIITTSPARAQPSTMNHRLSKTSVAQQAALRSTIQDHFQQSDLTGQSCTRARCDCPAPLDDFNRRDGGLGRPWSGREGLGGYQIINQQLGVVGGGPIYWRRDIFGSDQVVCVKFAKVDPIGEHQSLLLKVQGDWRQGAIAVFYNAITRKIGV